MGVKSCVIVDMLCKEEFLSHSSLECVHITFQGEVVIGVAVIIQFGSKHSLDSCISRHRENLLDMQLNTQLCCHKDQYRTSLHQNFLFC